jgi:hypothetical protein
MTEAAGSSLRIVPIKVMVSRPPYCDFLTESAMRQHVHNSERRYNSRGDLIPGNGMIEAGVIVRLGRRVLIDLNKFDQWLLNLRDVSLPSK